MRQIILLSSPRSGNTWCRYIIETMFNIRTIGYDYTPIEIVPLRYLLHGFMGYRTDCMVVKKHARLNENLNGNEKLIYIVRDINRLNTEEVLQPKKLVEEYNNNQIDFENWEGEKIKIEYDDLKNNPAKIIDELSIFLGIEKNEEKFTENIEKHIKNSLTLYCDIARQPSRTYGRNV